MSTTTTTFAGRPALRFERHLAHPVPTVWRAVTEPDRLSGWYPLRVTAFEPRVGGRIVFDDGEGTVLRGTVTDWDPPRLFAFDEHADPAGRPAPERDDHLRIELTDEPGGCLLVLVHVPADPATAEGASRGWQACLAQLVTELAAG
ncbi:SRPBCC domain-containing protein [Streptomyces sp. DSM 44915]|uniref:SRPBCC domain-containing protein n=1 Tax=Streptomyces chisholmiae TaxID=3075540 RepID=A0ABU2JNN6_9ACTN|nr:SRPBCC domain-containing protein [Streptomyces sp. DSM 44915]MDT0266606.1 SRPBCC domain-containing protein [Streptomyces sp. DSM 44915]